jgi:hypothetical protein
MIIRQATHQPQRAARSPSRTIDVSYRNDKQLVMYGVANPACFRHIRLGRGERLVFPRRLGLCDDDGRVVMLNVIGRYWPPATTVATAVTACGTARDRARAQATLLVEVIAENVLGLEQQVGRMQQLIRMEMGRTDFACRQQIWLSV